MTVTPFGAPPQWNPQCVSMIVDLTNDTLSANLNIGSQGGTDNIANSTNHIELWTWINGAWVDNGDQGSCPRAIVLQFGGKYMITPWLNDPAKGRCSFFLVTPDPNNSNNLTFTNVQDFNSKNLNITVTINASDQPPI